MPTCQGCKQELKSEKYLKCRSCVGRYHHDCVSMKLDHFLSLSREYLLNWICPDCNSISRRAKPNINTPVRQLHQQPTPTDDCMDISCDNSDMNKLSANKPQPSSASVPVSIDQFNMLLNTINMWRNDMNTNMLNIRDDIKGTLLGIQAEMKSLRSEQATLKQNITLITNEIQSIQVTIQSQTGNHTSLKKRVDDLASTACQQITPANSDLVTKVEYLEQQARQCNVEICNVPERRSEDLLQMMETIGSAIHFSYTQNEIVSIHRVPQAPQGSDRPRNVIVKFTTRIQRDNMLSAYRKTKSLESDKLGIAGTPSKIYLNEHQTLKKKQLYRKCREVAKELQYKHVWLRSSTIRIRQGDDTKIIVIRNEKDLENLRASAENNQVLKSQPI